MNLLLFHVFPLITMIMNCLTNHWVLWSGTLEIENIIPIDLDIYWGLYSIGIGTNLLGDAFFIMSIPNFIEFNTNNFNLNILTKNTLPLYYSVYVLYIICILYECVNVAIGLINYHKVLDHNIIRIYYLTYLNLLRSCFSVFFIWALFTYYNLSSLCLNDFIPTDNDRFIGFKSNNEVCSYGWNSITIIGNEVVLGIFNLYVFWIYCNNRRLRANSDANNDMYLPIRDYILN